MMRTVHPKVRKERAFSALIFGSLTFGLLLVQAFRVQILSSGDWTLQSDSNRLRPVTVSAPRGAIFDRNGLVMVDNVPGYLVNVLRDTPKETIESLEALRTHLGLSDEKIVELKQRVRLYEPLIVDVDASFEEVAVIEERKSDFPGVFIEMVPKRRYVGGEAISHALGYVGEVSTEELETEMFSNYERGTLVGKTGVELQYEGVLQGRNGVRYLEVDAVGRIVGSMVGIQEDTGDPGKDIELALDLDLMRWIHEIFPDSLPGAVVALDPTDGGVLALYSAPTFNPNSFVGGLSTEDWENIESDPGNPMLNRTIMGLYPPASTWKLAAAAIALDLGVVGPHEVMPIPCTGSMSYGGLQRGCWLSTGHGFLDLAGAIAHSCNVYFYQLGLRVGLDPLLEAGNRIGFNQQCGIDLPGERNGVFPESRDFWERRFGYTPLNGEVLSLAIGQGPNSQTPLKMAQFYLAIARDGTAPTPHIFGERVSTTDGWSLDLSSESIDQIREGLRAVTAPGGTAHLTGSLEHWEVLGKTGTAQNASSRGQDHAWFAGMVGPWGKEPEIVVVVLVEFGESGSSIAAPIAVKTADYYLRKKYGMSVDTIQTLAEHLQAGRPTPWARW
ncbi:MAG TPA: penicillin-binding protein 2 [Gemmatimonadetes bacterium]|nr:penicillin-binding protein 2 [Gemmatimonadota bacterium]